MGERAARVDSEAREDGQSSAEGGGWDHISIISLTPMSRNRSLVRASRLGKAIVSIRKPSLRPRTRPISSIRKPSR